MDRKATIETIDIEDIIRSGVGNLISNSGDGFKFEHNVQALFVILAMCEGTVAPFPRAKISHLKFQARLAGVKVDDLVISANDVDTHETRKIFIQIKRNVRFVKSDPDFAKTIKDAWGDFNNKSIFDKGRDCLAMVTGPVRDSDKESFPWLCEIARNQPDLNEFDRFISNELLSDTKKKFISGFKELMEGINNGQPVPIRALHQFLASFYVFFPDLWYSGGIIESFAETLLLSCINLPPAIAWSVLMERIPGWNSASASLTRANIIDILRERIGVCVIPARKVMAKRRREGSKKCQVTIGDSVKGEHIKLPKGVSLVEMALLSLIGEFSVEAEEDITIVSGILAIAPDSLVNLLHKIDAESIADIESSSGCIILKKREYYFRMAARSLYSKDIKRFEDVAVSLLREYDHSLDRPASERLYVAQNERGLSGSALLRKGICEGVAILCTNIMSCKSCSASFVDNEPAILIRRILERTDWRVWGTIDMNLYCLAEASPREYLAQVEKIVKGRKSIFATLVSEENGFGIMGQSFTVGLVRSLVHISWDGKYLASVTTILARMGEADSGGQITPRPRDALASIYLPLAPKTNASVKSRVAAIEKLREHHGNLLAQVIPLLLPQELVSFVKDEYNPKFRVQGFDPKTCVGTWKDVWEQYEAYERIAVDLAVSGKLKIADLIARARLWSPVCLQYLEKKLKRMQLRISALEGQDIWCRCKEALRFVGNRDKGESCRHKAESEQYLAFLRRTMTIYEPKELLATAKDLFSWSADNKDLDAKRCDCIKQIWDTAGVSGIVELSNIVDYPSIVGSTLAQILGDRNNCALIDLLRRKEVGVQSAIAGFVSEMFKAGGWSWYETQYSARLSEEEKLRTMLAMPFCSEVWERLDKELGDNQPEYWRKAKIVYMEDGQDSMYVARKFIEVKRPTAALRALHKYKREESKFLDAKLTYDALMLFTDKEAQEEEAALMRYDIIEGIKYVQSSPDIEQDKLVKLELAFVGVMEFDFGNHLRPLAIERLIACDVSAFMEFLCCATHPEDGAIKPVSDAEKIAAENSFKILYNWSIVPGLQPDGTFNAKQFNTWFRLAQSQAKKQKRSLPFEAFVGAVLSHAPKDSSGFWICKDVAKVLDRKSARRMRSHFLTAIFNSRGVHLVDSKGLEDEALARKYEKMGQEADEERFPRLAVTMRDLAKEVREMFRQMNDRVK